MTVTIRPLIESDLEFLSEVRHRPETLPFLHDQRVFSLEETRSWFRNIRPEWYLIVCDDEPAGYIRTSDRDLEQRSIKVGADVHPSFRRKHVATDAYLIFFHDLKQNGWKRVWLEVLVKNAAAKSLYLKLGFELVRTHSTTNLQIDDKTHSIVMSLLLI